MSVNGPGWSPDGGAFWRKDGKIYWEDGEITDGNEMIREMIGVKSDGEDYSVWTNEHRARVKAEKAAERAEAEMAHEKWVAEVRVLQESAKAKLTVEEYEAVQVDEYRL